jgi:hypothetical protein
MDDARTLAEYRSKLQALLQDAAVTLTDDQAAALREVVRERRNGRRDQVSTPVVPPVRQRAEEVVTLLAAAARELRPRETQELDDLVAGRAPKPEMPTSFPVRLRRSGRSI